VFNSAISVAMILKKGTLSLEYLQYMLERGITPSAAMLDKVFITQSKTGSYEASVALFTRLAKHPKIPRSADHGLFLIEV
jgi:hypothetical protein